MFSFSLPTLLLVSLTSALPSTNHAGRPIYWLLAGDSTTAPDGGWGDAFLSTTVASPSSGHNYGHSGATTASFRAGGDWSKVLADIVKYKKSYDKVVVTIQFGHNDQKPANNVSQTAYKTNLAEFTTDVKASGGIPILITPLTRRNFNSSGVVADNLIYERIGTTVVAQGTKTTWIDLNRASQNYVNAIGKTAASRYNYEADDWTHLNPWGGVVFARMVSDLLVEAWPELKKDTIANATMSAQIKAGVPV